MRRPRNHWARKVIGMPVGAVLGATAIRSWYWRPFQNPLDLLVVVAIPTACVWLALLIDRWARKEMPRGRRWM